MPTAADVTALTRLASLIDPGHILDRLYDRDKVTLDLARYMDKPLPSGSVGAGLVASLWNPSKDPVTDGYLHLQPVNWTPAVVNPAPNIDVDTSRVPPLATPDAPPVQGYHTDYGDMAVFPRHTNRFAVFGGIFHPDTTYRVDFEAGSPATGVTNGTYRIEVADGELVLTRIEEYRSTLGWAADQIRR